MKCIYCLKEKLDDSFSLEHIIPQACGGSLLADSLFQTKRVCEKCNNLCGLFIDSGFLKSWFLSNSKAEMSYEHTQIGHSNIVYPSYLGTLLDISTDDESCDFWVWPLGSRVYHFYPREENFQTLAGGNPINKRKGKGFAFLMLSQEVLKNKSWIKKTIVSFINFFHPAKLYTYKFQANDKSGTYKLKKTDDSVSDYVLKIDSVKDIEHQAEVLIDLDISNRFFSKIALGVGFNIYGEEFLSLPYTEELSKALWYRPGRERPLTQGQNFVLNKNNLPSRATDVYNWPFGNILTIFPVDQGLALAMGFFGRLATLTLLSKETSRLVPALSIPQDGMAYLWSAESNFKIGPIDFFEYVAHRLGEYSIANLAKFESKYAK